MASISSIQIYNAKNAYEKQIKFSGFSKQKKTAATPANPNVEKASEDTIDQFIDDNEKDGGQ